MPIVSHFLLFPLINSTAALQQGSVSPPPQAFIPFTRLEFDGALEPLP